MKTVFRVTIVSFVVGLVAMSAFPKRVLAATTPQEMHVSCTAPNPKHQTGLHRPKGDSNHWIYSIVLEGDARFVDGPHWSYPGSNGNDPDWGLVTGGKDKDSSMDWSSPGKTGEFNVLVSGKISCGDGGGGQPIDFSVEWDADVCPGVQKIQYNDPSDGYVDVAGTLYVLKGTKVTFKAIPDQLNAKFCDGEPEWGGNAGATGTGETKDVTFDTLSTSLTDYKTVTVTGGQTSTVNVVVYDLTPVTTPHDDFTDRSQTRYGINELIHLSFTSSPEGITATNVGGLKWTMTGSATDTLSQPTDPDGTGSFTAGSTPGAVTLKLQVTGGPAQGSDFSLTRTIVVPDEGWIVKQSFTPSVWHMINSWSVGFWGGIYIGPKDVSFKNLQFSEATCQSTASGWLKDVGFDNYTHIPGADAVVGAGNASYGSYVSPDKIYSGHMAPGDPKFVGTGVAPAYAPGNFNWPIPWRYRIPGTSDWIQITIANQHFTSDATGAAMGEKAGSEQVTTNAADATSIPPGF